MSSITNKHLPTIKVAAFSLLSALASSQSSAILVSAVGDSFTINFDGLVDGLPQAGLTSSAAFTLTDISSDGAGGQNWAFDIALNNTSSAPITRSRVTVLAFNSASGIDTAQSSTAGLFTTVSSGNMQDGVRSAGNFDVCFTSHGPGCTGYADDGIGFGGSALFSVVLNTDMPLNALDLTDFHVRYQAVLGTPYGRHGYGTVSEVPVPASVWLMGSALLGLARIGRRPC